MTGIDTAYADAIDALLRRLAHWRRKRKAAKAAQTPPAPKNGEHDDR